MHRQHKLSCLVHTVVANAVDQSCHSINAAQHRATSPSLICSSYQANTTHRFHGSIDILIGPITSAVLRCMVKLMHHQTLHCPAVRRSWRGVWECRVPAVLAAVVSVGTKVDE